MTYERKFANLILACEHAKKQETTLMVHHPEVLGDNYEEIVESLNRISAANILLRILPPIDRGKPDIKASSDREA